MATADELLSTIDTDKTLIIDKDLRTIIIPSSVKNLGVESDDDVLRLKFSMPRMYGDIDLSTFSIYINYMNAAGVGDVYTVDDMAFDDNTITFTWLVSRITTAAKGRVRFIVCMKLYDSAMEEIIKEYNTTIASLPVLEGLETSEAAIEQNPDILTYINELINMKVDVITPTIGDNGNWFWGDTDTGKPSRGADGKSAYSYAQEGGYTGTEAEFAAKLAEETGTVPENVALLEDVTVDEASGDFIPMLSPNGTEYRLSIGDNGVPVIKNANGATVWSGTSGGSSGGDTGGDDPGGGGTDTTWTSGVPYTLTIIADEYVNQTSGAFVTYAGWSRTDYTPCAGAARIVHTGNGYSSIYCAWYDINKNFISSFGISVSTSTIPEEIEVLADAAFFVMSTKSEFMNAMTVTPYET